MNQCYCAIDPVLGMWGCHVQVGYVARLSVDLATSILSFDVKQHAVRHGIVMFNVNVVGTLM